MPSFDEGDLLGLASTDFSGLDPGQPMASAAEAIARLERTLFRISEYFGIPPIVRHYPSLGDMLATATGAPVWRKVFDIASQIKDQFSTYPKLEKDALKTGNRRAVELFYDSGPRYLTATVFRLAEKLPKFALESEANMRDKNPSPADG